MGRPTNLTCVTAAQGGRFAKVVFTKGSNNLYIGVGDSVHVPCSVEFYGVVFKQLCNFFEQVSCAGTVACNLETTEGVLEVSLNMRELFVIDGDWFERIYFNNVSEYFALVDCFCNIWCNLVPV